MKNIPQATTYKDAGVDIEAGNNLVEMIKPFVKMTERSGSSPDLGGFGGLFDLAQTGYKDPVLVAGNDGVGTKLEVAKIVAKHDTVGIDLVAMVVNDLVVQGAEPLFFLDYFAAGKLDVEIATQVIKGIADGCKQSGCALIGGETAEMPGLYQGEDYDLAGFAVGAVERADVLPKLQSIKAGDVLLGLSSSGVHSNGFSLVRHIIKTNNLSYSLTCNEFVGTLGERLLVPTKIYVKDCLNAIKAGGVKALAHITGGGITENLPRALPDCFGAEVDLSAWEFSDIFKWIEKTGNIAQAEMLKTFNCGIGMVLIVAQERLADVQAALGEQESLVIGRIIEAADKSVVYK